MLFFNIVVGITLVKVIWDKVPRSQHLLLKLALSSSVIAALIWFTLILPPGMVIPGVR